MGKRPHPITADSVERAGATKLFDYQDAGFTLQNAGAGLFRRSGAQAILPDGTKTPIFRNKSNEVEKRQLLAYLEANHSDSLVPTTTKEVDPEGILGTGVGYGAEDFAKVDKENALKVEELEEAIKKQNEEIEKLKKAGQVKVEDPTDDDDDEFKSRSTSEDQDLDLQTVKPSAPIGATSVTYQTIIREPSAAVRQQEKYASEQLRKSRIEKARQKRSLLRRRQEALQEVGIGRKVLSGEEQDLDLPQVDSRISQATGRRGGRSRGSLITGSRGGIGFYSRYT